MIPVAADHTAHVVDGYHLPRLVADVLPARNFLQHNNPISSQASRKWRTGIVRSSDNIGLELGTQICASQRCARAASPDQPGNVGAGPARGA